ncbi:MAG: S8 family peptidase [Bdellovibrionota bacterium]|jgi:subtilisin family serine protease
MSCLLSKFPRWTVLLLAVFIPFYANAATDYVYEGEFVIEPPEKGPFALQQGEAATLSSFGLQELKPLGEGSSLVTLKGAHSYNASNTSKSNIREVNAADLQLCEELVANGIVKSCSPNYQISIAARPNDSKFNEQWGLSKNLGIDTETAWNVTTGSQDMIVAVIDTGIDYTHPDLAANIWVNNGEIPGNGIDDDGNGYIDDVYGMSTIGAKGDPMDANGHGTHVAGVIGASGNNGIGISGINWNIKLLGCRFLNAKGSGSLAGAVEAINYVVSMKKRGFNIVAMNNSWGGGGFSQVMYNAIEKALAEGITFVAAAGNESNNNDVKPTYPAGYNLANVISVGAIGRSGSLADFSNFGAKTVTIAAPGVSIVSTYLNGTYKSLSGTSMATPFVTGSVALLKSLYPKITPTELTAHLKKTGTSNTKLDGLVESGKVLNLGRLINGNVEPEVGNQTVCSYSATEGRQAPSYVSLEEDIISNVDELEFPEVTLGFEFPFYGVSYKNITISPNGVIYLQNQSSADYRNGSDAPLNSIAVLHTDLIFPQRGHGIRVKGDANSQSITWHARSYASIYKDDVTVNVTLYPSGLIETSYAFATPEVASLVATSATIGVRGSASDSAYTYAYNNASLYDGMTLQFTPNCQVKTVVEDDKNKERENQTPMTLSSIKISGVRKDGTVSRKAIPGGLMNISLIGTGSGEVPLNLILGGRRCGPEFSGSLENGTTLKVIDLPRIVRRYKNITVGSTAIKSNRLRVKQSKKVNIKRTSKKVFTKDCMTLIRKLNAAN